MESMAAVLVPWAGDDGVALAHPGTSPITQFGTRSQHSSRMPGTQNGSAAWSWTTRAVVPSRLAIHTGTHSNWRWRCWRNGPITSNN